MVQSVIEFDGVSRDLVAKRIVSDGAGLADEAKGKAIFEDIGECNAAGVQVVNSSQNNGDVGCASVVLVVFV